VAGFYMDRGDTTRYNNISFFGFPKNVWIRSTEGQISTQIFTGFTNESGPGTSDYAIYLEKGAHPFLSVCFNGGEVLLGNVYVGAGVEETNFVGVAMPSYPVGAHGFHIYGKNTKLLGVHIGSTDNSTNSYDGIKVYSGADGTQIIGCSAKKRRYGITIEDGATNTTVIGNNFLGNNTAAYSFGSTVRANSRIIGNQGIDDYISSLSVAASTLGTVTRKIEVFDEAGSSLGFIPVYDSIA
jgi:parallel beta-helix repeat protein